MIIIAVRGVLGVWSLMVCIIPVLLLPTLLCLQDSDGDLRRKGTQKAFPQKIKTLMTKGESLLANRRGIVSNFNEQEKPSFSAQELIENRRRGISFSSIGKKLGIDNTKEEVLSVFSVMKEMDSTLSDVGDIDRDCPMVKSYPTPFWYFFNSELDIIAKESIPVAQHFLQTNVQERVASRLGEKAGEMLCNYLEVNEIVKEEISSSISNCSQSSPLGRLNMWSNGLQRKLITSCCDTLSSVAKSAMQHSATQPDQHVGRCQCGGVKVLKVNWKNVSDLPSFFWGCGRYRQFERYQHDRAVSFRSATLKTITDNAHHMAKMTSKDLSENSDLLKDDVELVQKLLGCSNSQDCLSQLEAVMAIIDKELQTRSQGSPLVNNTENDCN